MLDFVIEQEDENKRLTINGELNIQNASALKELLINSLKDTESLVINLENITKVDLSCLQILCSAHKTAISSKLNISLSHGSSDAFVDAVKDSGYLRYSGCGSKCDEQCLWTECKRVGV